MNARDLKAELMARGAQKSHLEAKVVPLMEDMLAEYTDEQLKEIGSVTVEKKKNEFAALLESAQRTGSTLSSLKADVSKLISQGNSVIDSMEVAIQPSSQVQQAIYLYAGMLKTTQEIFGTELSNDVMRATIEAASYATYRTMMGESKPLVTSNYKKGFDERF